MKLSATQETEVLELEVTKVTANRMEHRQLLAEKVLTTTNDKVLYIALQGLCIPSK